MANNLCVTYTEVVVVVDGWILYRQMSSYRSIPWNQWTSAPCGASVHYFQGMERYSDILLYLEPEKIKSMARLTLLHRLHRRRRLGERLLSYIFWQQKQTLLLIVLLFPYGWFRCVVLTTILHQLLTVVESMILRTFPIFYEVCDICSIVLVIKK